MKKYLLLLNTLLYLLVFNLCIEAQVNWPFANPNQQASVVGSLGEYRWSRRTGDRFHLGVDLTNGNSYDVYAINSGNVIYNNGGNNWDAWSSYVKVGNVIYYHIKPVPDIINHVVTYVNSGDYIGDMLNNNNIHPHVHLQENNTNYLNHNLQPYVDSAAPYFDSTHINNGVQLYRNGLLKSTTNYNNLLLNQHMAVNGIQYCKIYNKIDIAAHIVDARVDNHGHGNGGQLAPFQISWRVRNSTVIDSGIFKFDVMPNNLAASACFHPLSVHPGSPSIHIITSHPSQTPYDRYWNTGLRTNTTETWPNNNSLDANYFGNARTPDGLYLLEINAFDVDFNNNPNNNAPQRTIKILIDNFRPYIEKINIYREGDTTLIYSRGWVWNGSALTFGAAPTCPVIANGKNLVVKVFTSEPMQNVNLNAFGIRLNNTHPIDSTYKKWSFTVNPGISTPGNYCLVITGNDLAGNPVEGFRSANNVSIFPIRQDSVTWNPLPLAKSDSVHFFQFANNNALAPNFSGTATQTGLPFTVQFSDKSTGLITSRIWNFGDSTKSNAQNPSHTYATSGTFTVKLNISDCTNTSLKEGKAYIALLPFISKVEVGKNNETASLIVYNRTLTSGKFTFTSSDNPIPAGVDLWIRVTTSGPLNNLQLSIQNENKKVLFTFNNSTPLPNDNKVWSFIVPSVSLGSRLNTILFSAADANNNKLLWQTEPLVYPYNINGTWVPDIAGLTTTDQNYYLYVMPANNSANNIQCFKNTDCSVLKALFVNNTNFNYSIDFGDNTSNTNFKPHSVLVHAYAVKKTYQVALVQNYPFNLLASETIYVQF